LGVFAAASASLVFAGVLVDDFANCSSLATIFAIVLFLSAVAPPSRHPPENGSKTIYGDSAKTGKPCPRRRTIQCLDGCPKAGRRQKLLH
jgi:hypothetical protein